MITRVSKKKKIYIHVCEIRFANSTVTRLEGTKKRTLYISKEMQTHMYCVQWVEFLILFLFFVYMATRKELFYSIIWLVDFFFVSSFCVYLIVLCLHFFLSLLLPTRFVDKRPRKEGWQPIEEQKKAISFFLTSKSVFFSCSSSKSNIAAPSLYLILFADLHLTT